MANREVILWEISDGAPRARLSWNPDGELELAVWDWDLGCWRAEPLALPEVASLTAALEDAAENMKAERALDEFERQGGFSSPST